MQFAIKKNEVVETRHSVMRYLGKFSLRMCWNGDSKASSQKVSFSFSLVTSISYNRWITLLSPYIFPCFSDFLMRMHQNSVNSNLKTAINIKSSNNDFLQMGQNFGDFPTLKRTISRFSLSMLRNDYLGVYSEKSDPSLASATPISYKRSVTLLSAYFFAMIQRFL